MTVDVLTKNAGGQNSKIRANGLGMEQNIMASIYCRRVVVYAKSRKVFILLVTAAMALLTAITAYAYSNATNQHNPGKCNVRYAAGRIDWTDPELDVLNGGTFSRIAITRQISAGSVPAAEFIEIGWLKQVQSFLGFQAFSEYINVTYTDQNGLLQNAYVQRPNNPSHHFIIQYDPVVNLKWYLGYDGQYIPASSTSTGFSTNFVKGCVAVAGGETLVGTESMGPTRYYELASGKIKGTGIIYASLWPTNTVRQAQPPYMCFPRAPWDQICGP